MARMIRATRWFFRRYKIKMQCSAIEFSAFGL
jgi:hypothetical protein